jgi:GNAT superfamily N-acetyltransferase
MAEIVLQPLELDPEELSKTLGLLRRIWPDPEKMTLRYLEWLYLENPDGNAVGVNAWDGETLAGHYVVVPAKVHLLGRSTSALLSLHTAVHPDYRGKGLFLRMAERTYEGARQRGFDHVFGVANANSTHGFVRDLGFQLVSPLDLRIITGWPVLDEEADRTAVWRREWSDAALGWRLRHPLFRYRQRRGRGLVFYLLARRGVQTIVRIERAKTSPPTLGTGLSGLPIPRVWVGLNPGIRFRGPSLAMPRRLRSSPLNLIFRSLTTKSLRLDSAKIAFEGIDFDVF